MYVCNLKWYQLSAGGPLWNLCLLCQ